MRQIMDRLMPAARVATIVLAAGAMLLLGAVPARADGNSLIGYPQSNIMPKNTFHVDFDTVGQGASMNGFVGFGITYGLGNGLLGRRDNQTGGDKDGILGRAEVGVDYLISAGGSAPPVDSQDRFYFNAKVQLYNDDATNTRIVAGGYNIGSTSIYSPRELYVLFSRVHKFGKVQIGVTHAFGPTAGLTTPAGNSDATYLQGSFNRKIVGRLFGAFAGYSGLSTQSRTSVALAYFLDNTYKSSFAAGVLRYNDSSVRPGRYQVYFGFDYDFTAR